MDEEQEKRLWQREKTRRQALWQLQGLRPGDPAAAEWLVMLNEVEFLERLEPIGEGCKLTIEQLRKRVPIVEVRGVDRLDAAQGRQLQQRLAAFPRLVGARNEPPAATPERPYQWSSCE